MSFVLLCGEASFAVTPSSKDIIQTITNLDQSQADPKQAIEIDHTQAITLRTGEHAYLSGVIFENAGRNFWAGYILTRPKLKQSRILPDFGGQSNTFRVHAYPYNKKSMSLTEIESAGSGQGEVSSGIDLVYFDGWEGKILTSIESSSYFGRYDEKLGEEDCRTGNIVESSLKILAQRNEVLKISKSSNACKNAKVINKTEKVKIVIH